MCRKNEMDLKLLEKLVRLANNNPNEHEANLAARRACKLIEDGKFQFNQIPPTSSQSPPLTYNDIRRSTEPFWRSTKPPSYPGYKFYDEARDVTPDWWKILEEIENQRRKQREKTAEQYRYEPFSERKAREKRKLKCKTCNQEKETLFIGLSEFFECNECQWASYQKEKK